MKRPLIALCAALISAPAVAGVIASQDFNSTEYVTDANVWGYNSGGTVTWSAAFDATGGPDGSRTQYAQFDTTALGPSVEGWWYYGVSLNQYIGRSDAMTSTNLADYSFTADAKALGGVSTAATVRWVAQFQIPDGPDTDTNNDRGFELMSPKFSPSEGAWATSTSTLDTWSFSAGTTLAQFQAVVAADTFRGIWFSMLVEDGGGDHFGRDSGNAIYMDNVSFSQVPEPTGLGIIAVGAALALRRLRSK